MAILGNKCDRCGTRTKHTENGNPICEECAQEMELAVAASRETVRNCPADGEPLAKEVAHMLVIDRCPKCKGVWLDGGELERIQASTQDEAIRSMTMGFTNPFV